MDWINEIADWWLLALGLLHTHEKGMTSDHSAHFFAHYASGWFGKASNPAAANQREK
jgi:hypothetical protein